MSQQLGSLLSSVREAEGAAAAVGLFIWKDLFVLVMVRHGIKSQRTLRNLNQAEAS